jgi:hypothetical protein
MAVTATVVKNMADGEITIQDGSTPAKVCTVVVDEGDLKFQFAARESVAVYDRTELSHLRKGKAKVLNGSFKVKYKQFLHDNADSNVTPHEAIFLKAIGWTSSNTDGGGVPTVDLVFTVVSPVMTEDAEIITIARCYDMVEGFSEGMEDALDISFKYFEQNISVAKGTQAMTTTAGPTSAAPTTGA